jgi:ribosomal protein L21E
MNYLRPLWLIPVVSILTVASLPAEVSQLWGVAGEKWTPASRLPDFSYAGYRRGEEPFRIPSASISVADFGAKGDGRTDDTAAFKKAIAAGAGKVIQVPAGRFLLSDILRIQVSNLVLRGAGPGQTIFVFTRNLNTIEPRMVKNDGGTPTSDWSWAGGLFVIGDGTKHSESPVGVFTRVTAPAQRGANRITLEKALFKVGDEVTLVVHDTADKSLLKYLYHDQTGDISGLNRWQCRQIFRVRAVNGGEITLDRGLRFDVRADWRPTVEPFRPTVTDVGIEGVTFEFPAAPYAGHFKELGWNPVAIRPNAAHCWLKDLVIRNGDNGPFVEGAAFCTLENIRITADPQRRGKDGTFGHHGITLEGDDCLCTNFAVQTEFIHDITVQSALGCVFAGGRAENLDMDHHRWASYENLFTDIDAGLGKRLFQSSGGGERGMHSAAGETFWNIRSRTLVPWPKGFGPDFINLIGLPMRDPQILDVKGRWLETIPPGQVQPADLHAAMLAKRLAASEK